MHTGISTCRLKYYEQSSEERYHGSRDIVSLVNFINSRSQHRESDIARDVALPLNDETFLNYIGTQQGVVFVDFFAPWYVHT